MGKNLSYLTVLLIANIISFAVFAQDRAPLSGFIKNSVTGAPVSKASVNIKGEEVYDHRLVMLKEFFAFIQDKAFPFTLVISAQGYKTKEVVVDSDVVPV